MDTKEGHKMGIGNVLISRLRDKGLMPVEIPRLIKDAYYIIQKGMVSGRGLVNRKLERMGWETQILDTITYDLMIFCFENGDNLMNLSPGFVPWMQKTGEGLPAHE
jgi:hypothetical protein